MAPCLKQLDAECFAAHPAWAKRAFAYRLVHLLTPKPLTKRLPKGLRLALIAPGVEIPPGVDLPGGIVISPGAEIPAGWTAGDPLPDGALPAPAAPPPEGPAPPLYTDPWSPGPAHAPTPGLAAPALPVTVEVVGSTADGNVGALESTWDAAHGASSGAYVATTEQAQSVAMSIRKYPASTLIYRSFFYFDLSALPSGKSVTSAILAIQGTGYAHSSVTVQQGTQGDTLDGDDYNAFTGSYFDKQAWTVLGNTLTFDAAGLTYISTVLGSTAKLCCREHDYDYLSVTPTDYTIKRNGACYTENATPANRPKLTIIYQP